MTTMRAKLRVTSVEKFSESFEKLNFAAIYGGPEDNTYAKATPCANAHFDIANPALIGQFAPGDTFYVDFTPVPKETT